MWRKTRTFSEPERVGSPSFLSPCKPTSTSSLAARNMQTHFIDFWSFGEKPNWIVSETRASGVRSEEEERKRKRRSFKLKQQEGDLKGRTIHLRCHNRSWVN